MVVDGLPSTTTANSALLSAGDDAEAELGAEGGQLGGDDGGVADGPRHAVGVDGVAGGRRDHHEVAERVDALPVAAVAGQRLRSAERVQAAEAVEHPPAVAARGVGGDGA